MGIDDIGGGLFGRHNAQQRRKSNASLACLQKSFGHQKRIHRCRFNLCAMEINVICVVCGFFSSPLPNCWHEFLDPEPPSGRARHTCWNRTEPYWPCRPGRTWTTSTQCDRVPGQTGAARMLRISKNVKKHFDRMWPEFAIPFGAATTWPPASVWHY